MAGLRVGVCVDARVGELPKALGYAAARQLTRLATLSTPQFLGQHNVLRRPAPSTRIRRSRAMSTRILRAWTRIHPLGKNIVTNPRKVSLFDRDSREDVPLNGFAGSKPIRGDGFRAVQSQRVLRSGILDPKFHFRSFPRSAGCPSVFPAVPLYDFYELPWSLQNNILAGQGICFLVRFTLSTRKFS